MGCCISTWVGALGKCLPWNPSVTATPCQLPLAREPRAVPADNFARRLFSNRYFPDPPGIVTLQKGSANTSRPEGGGLGRSPKTEGATACRRSQFRTIAFGKSLLP